jgi:hypothetical protein
MKRMFRLLVTLLAVMAPMAAALPGCIGPDNPTPVLASPPPPPKPEELVTPKVGAKKVAYGSGSRYQKSMESLNNPGAN